MNKRDYYSVRTGKIKPNEVVNLKVLKKHFLIIYRKLEKDGYFQKYFGFYCVDLDEVDGELGSDIPAVVFINLKKENLYPIESNIENYNEDDLFDMIEFLFDHCSKPIDGHYHQHMNCGYHYEVFNDEEGQIHFRTLINSILKLFLLLVLMAFKFSNFHLYKIVRNIIAHQDGYANEKQRKKVEVKDGLEIEKYGDKFLIQIKKLK